jgi:hypothetical protein
VGQVFEPENVMAQLLNSLNEYSVQLTGFGLVLVISIELAVSFIEAARGKPPNHRRRVVMMRGFCCILYLGMFWQCIRLLV